MAQQLSIIEIYDLWIGVGGSTGDLGVYMTAIALAESGGWTDAHSPSDDWGVWQINGVHAAEFPKLWPYRLLPEPNARMAKAISGNGTNVGPWCTAWVNPANCGHYHAPPPDPGSPAGTRVAAVAAVVHDPSVSLGHEHFPPGFGAVHHPGQHGWGHLQKIVGPIGTQWRAGLGHSINRAKGI